MNWLRRRVRELRSLSSAADAYGISKWQALSGFIELSRQEQYSPTEILGLGLLDPASPIKTHRYVSSEKLLPIQHRLNPAAQHCMTENKLDFHGKCIAERLPTPRILGMYGERVATHPSVPVVDSAAGVLSSVRDLSGFVFKPLNGTHGDGVLVLSRHDDQFIEAAGKRFTAQDLLAHADKLGYSTWLLQERLLPHPELVRLSGLPLIQTIRLVTFVEQDGQISLLAGWLRMVGGSTGADNFSFGRTGNFVGSIDLTSGLIDHALAKAPHGFGLTQIFVHPLTGVHFKGYQVPEFAAACETVKQAAAAFSPLRTIGWDVAVTDHGISLIEGNVTWDALPTLNDLTAIYRYISASA